MNRRFRVCLILPACLILLNCSYLKQRTVIFQGTSMLPTIKDGDKLRMQQLDGPLKAKLARGDIVMFKYPKDPSKAYIKRVIGLPGEVVEIRTGQVWVDGNILTESYVDSKLNMSPRSLPAVVVPAHSYYVLGDNRDNSSDSRSWGFVPEELLMARVTDR